MAKLREASILLASLHLLVCFVNGARLFNLGEGSHSSLADYATETLFVIGDTHGDENYLFRTLLTTGYFTLSGQVINWRSDIPENENFTIEILGDMVDFGHFSKRNVLTVKRLMEDQQHGHRLRLLMGNHEEMLINKDLRYALGDFGKKLLKKAHAGERPEDFEILKWLATLPIVDVHRGVLMTHGGLSERLLRRIINSDTKRFAACSFYHLGTDPTQEQGRACGRAVMDFINTGAKEFFSQVLNVTENVIKAVRPSKPFYLEGSGSVLWYRGYSLMSQGAGKRRNCRDNAVVAAALGAHTSAVGHTTHSSIKNLCPQPRTAVPMFVTDTHYKYCARYGECDYAWEHKFHRNGVIDKKKHNVPQSLRINHWKDGSVKYDACYSMVSADMTQVECFPMGGLAAPTATTTKSMITTTTTTTTRS